MTTIDIDINKLKLFPEKTGQKRGGSKPPQYDPHLREERHRKAADQPGTVAITRQEKEGDKRYVDVIAKLKTRNGAPIIPPEIQDLNPIGDLKLRGTLYTIATGSVEIDKIETVHRKVKSLKAATELYLDLYHSVPAIHCDPESLDTARGPNGESFPGLDGSGIIIGIVDFGCDFRHKNFRQANGATRLRYLWDQSGDKTDLSPEEFDYGREFSADLINQALRDEDRAYDILKYAPATAAHGTHVMDIAAGNGREPNDFGGKPGPGAGQLSHPGIAPNVQLIFVHLKTFEEGFLGNSRYLLEAVDYIFKKADKLQMPAVVNLSLSSSGGPHDGTTLVEQGLAALVNAKPGRAIVVSAGNGYMKQSHVGDKVCKDVPTEILWYTDPRHTDPLTTKNEMEIWYDGDKELRVALYPPGREQPIGTVSLRETKELYDDDARTNRLGRIIHRQGDPNNEDNLIDIRLPHIAGVKEPWKIELSTAGEDVAFHAWIEQDDLGLSRFEKSTPDHTIGSISCNDATLAVGAFDTAFNASLAPPFEASSVGPTRLSRKGTEPERPKPDLSAPGVNIVAARARGGVTVMSGTSMAAPHVTGLMALLFQLVLRAGYTLPTFAKIREILSEPSDEQKPAGPKLLNQAVAADSNIAPGTRPDPRLGAGRVDGKQAIGFVATLLADRTKFEKAAAGPSVTRSPVIALQNFHVPPQPLKELLLGNGHKGSGNLGALMRILAEKSEKNEEILMWVEP